MGWITNSEGSFYVADDNNDIDPSSMLPEKEIEVALSSNLQSTGKLHVTVGSREFIGAPLEYSIFEDTIAGTITIKVTLKT